MGFSRMNNKGLTVRSMFFAAVVASCIIIAAGVLMGNWGEKYSSGITYDLGEYSNLEGYSEQAQIQKNKIAPSDADPGAGVDFESKMFRGAYGIIGGIFSPLTNVFNMVNSITNRYGIPSYVTTTILSLMFFAVITLIISSLLRQGRSQA